MYIKDFSLVCARNERFKNLIEKLNVLNQQNNHKDDIFATRCNKTIWWHILSVNEISCYSVYWFDLTKDN